LVLTPRIEKYLKRKNLEIEFYEKEIWNNEMITEGLVPFIRQLREMNVIIVSNKHLRKLRFLNYDRFIEISYPNCFQDLETTIKQCRGYRKPGVYLVAMGLPATLFCQEMHKITPQSWFLDLGSIWDSFCGIGAQRGFRKELYADPERYKKWLNNYYEKIYGNEKS